MAAPSNPSAASYPPPMNQPPPPAPPPSPPPKRKGLSKGVLVAIAAVVVVVIVVLGLGFSGLIPGFKLGGSSSGGASGPSYVITFTETGLPSGTTWSITLAGSVASSATPTITFSEKNGSYSYSVGSVPGFAANPTSGTVGVNGLAVNEAITFQAGYAVTFTEFTLPSGTMWSATLNGSTLSSTSGSIAFTIPNGVYAYSIPTVSGYTASPASGSVTVSGVAQSVPITFTPVPAGEYAVTFTESGLPGGTSWSVTLGGTLQSSTTTTITFNENNNTYPYTVGAVSGYTAAPSSGNVVVSGGPASVTITFTTSSNPLAGPQYAVTFDQSGLAADELWSTYASVKTDLFLYYGATSAGASMEYSAPDGTYYWSVSTDAMGANGNPYQPDPAGGTFTVSGGPVTIPVAFLPTYSVNFTETGLTPGAPWNVTLNGTTICYGTAPTNCTTDTTWTNGTLSFVVAALGYTASPATGMITVSGGNVSQAISFTSVSTYMVTFTETGLASGVYWYVTLDGVPGYGNAPSTIVFPDFPIGDFPFYDVSSAGYYSASPTSGSVTVTSGGGSQAIVFTAITLYPVTFTEHGLTSGSPWTVELNESEGNAAAPTPISVSAPAGNNSYVAYSTGYITQSGYEIVTTGTNAVSVTFSLPPPPPTLYNVTFNETGLPMTGGWGIELQNNGAYISLYTTCSNSSGAGTNLSCYVPDGNYSWSASTLYTPNYTASPTAGYLTVDGAGTIVIVSFVNTTASGQYLVAFAEDAYSEFGIGGTPNGSTWSVTLGGVTHTSQGMYIAFLATNGSTEAYTITPPAGYVVVPSSGSITGYTSWYQGDLSVEAYAFVSVVFAATDPPLEVPASEIASSLSGAPHGFAMAPPRDES
ncbi:MAG: hypothetical protein WA547_06475 [Thermoplasmata archaeon]